MQRSQPHVVGRCCRAVVGGAAAAMTASRHVHPKLARGLQGGGVPGRLGLHAGGTMSRTVPANHREGVGQWLMEHMKDLAEGHRMLATLAIAPGWEILLSAPAFDGVVSATV